MVPLAGICVGKGENMKLLHCPSKHYKYLFPFFTDTDKGTPVAVSAPLVEVGRPVLIEVAGGVEVGFVRVQGVHVQSTELVRLRGLEGGGGHPLRGSATYKIQINRKQ